MNRRNHSHSPLAGAAAACAAAAAAFLLGALRADLAALSPVTYWVRTLLVLLLVSAGPLGVCSAMGVRAGWPVALTLVVIAIGLQAGAALAPAPATLYLATAAAMAALALAALIRADVLNPHAAPRTRHAPHTAGGRRAEHHVQARRQPEAAGWVLAFVAGATSGSLAGLGVFALCSAGAGMDRLPDGSAVALWVALLAVAIGVSIAIERLPSRTVLFVACVVRAAGLAALTVPGVASVQSVALGLVVVDALTIGTLVRNGPHMTTSWHGPAAAPWPRHRLMTRIWMRMPRRFVALREAGPAAAHHLGISAGTGASMLPVFLGADVPVTLLVACAANLGCAVGLAWPLRAAGYSALSWPRVSRGASSKRPSIALSEISSLR